MWHFISDNISHVIEQDFICDDIREVSGGDSHRAYKISDGRKRFFVKVDSVHLQENFEAEAHGLNLLSTADNFRIPKVICTGTTSDKAYIVLEHMTLGDGESTDWREMGRQLAQLHLHTESQYGCHFNNFIGRTPQTNRWEQDWAAFYSQHRIGTLLQLMAANGIRFIDINSAVEQIHSLLKGYQPDASLLHGDLWRGNVAFFKHTPVVFDPACYYGDRETDLAMTELFGPFPAAFYEGYQEVWPLSEGYQQRKSIYQLYHLLNHALMFGGSYVNSAQETLKRLQKH